jgi:hypothetical protein
MTFTLHQWQRGPRTTFCLPPEPGVYALFLRTGAKLGDITPGERGLLYIGLAANHKGLKGRCHFNGQTRNHSPRKSLAVLLMEELSLTPVLFPKPDSTDTWGLDPMSEARLTAWMHANLELAIEACPDPDARETELVSYYAPPLNLKKCPQTTNHLRISRARSDVLALLKCQRPKNFVDGRSRPTSIKLQQYTKLSEAPLSEQNEAILHHLPVGTEIDTAEAIAARYALNPKSYRHRLRNSIAWYRKPQDWTFPVGSREWNDMIEVAERMAR